MQVLLTICTLFFCQLAKWLTIAFFVHSLLCGLRWQRSICENRQQESKNLERVRVEVCGQVRRVCVTCVCVCVAADSDLSLMHAYRVCRSTRGRRLCQRSFGWFELGWQQVAFQAAHGCVCEEHCQTVPLGGYRSDNHLEH